MAEREALVACAKALLALARCLVDEVAAAAARLRASEATAARTSTLAARVTGSDLRALSFAARDVIPQVDRRARENGAARSAAAARIAALRAAVATEARRCMPLLANNEAAAVVACLVQVAKVESVVETAADLASGDVSDYAPPLDPAR